MNKTCRDCKKEKDLTEFYRCKGAIRSECKKCTIIRNSLYQKKYQARKTSDEDVTKRRKYHVDYYQKNKERFAKYRQKHKQIDPDYHKNYQRMLRDEQRGETYDR